MSDEEPAFKPIKLIGKFEDDAKVFSNYEELKAWASAEKKAWAFYESEHHKAPHASDMMNYLQQIVSFVDQIGRSNSNRADPEQQLRNHVSRFASDCGFTSTSEFGSFVKDVGALNPKMASAIAHYLVKGEQRLPATLQGMAGATMTLYELGVLDKERVEHAGKSYSAMKSNWTKLHSRAIDEWSNYQITHDQTIKKANDDISAFHKLHASTLDEVKKQLDEFKSLCKEGLALRAPVEYWSTKARSHRREARNAKILFTQYAILSGILILLFAMFYVLPILSRGFEEKLNQFWPLAILFGLVGVFAWPLRIMVKFWMSHLHLATDAEERSTLIKTYLSMREAGDVSDEERAIVLPSLFRTTPTGIVKDDGGPSLHFETASKFIKPN